jgi:hypothetical protein
MIPWLSITYWWVRIGIACLPGPVLSLGAYPAVLDAAVAAVLCKDEWCSLWRRPQHLMVVMWWARCLRGARMTDGGDDARATHKKPYLAHLYNLEAANDSAF